MTEQPNKSGGFAGFLRENWLWIVSPIVLVIVLLVVLAYVLGGAESAPFVYNIF